MERETMRREEKKIVKQEFGTTTDRPEADTTGGVAVQGKRETTKREEKRMIVGKQELELQQIDYKLITQRGVAARREIEEKLRRE
jgi:hypothetical protein